MVGGDKGGNKGFFLIENEGGRGREGYLIKKMWGERVKCNSLFY